MGLENEPTPQSNFEERMKRAHEFIEKYNPPFPVYVDGWNNVFAETFRAWHDKYYYIDANKTVLAKSEYGLVGDEDAKIILDYLYLLD